MRRESCVWFLMSRETRDRSVWRGGGQKNLDQKDSERKQISNECLPQNGRSPCHFPRALHVKLPLLSKQWPNETIQIFYFIANNARRETGTRAREQISSTIRIIRKRRKFVMNGAIDGNGIYACGETIETVVSRDCGSSTFIYVYRQNLVSIRQQF